jgi:hypothetical protein
MESGKSYVLIVNNFSRSGLGFSIEFGGTGTFLGPKVGFEIDASQNKECDKTIIFNNKSESTTDPIIGYKWNFGNKSNPSRSTEMGPISVVYSGYGDKTAALTIETSRGCTVTKIIDFFVNPCCKDTSTLSVGGEKTNPSCFGENNGTITAQGFSGGGDFMFSIDGKNFQSNPKFRNLKPGLYNIYIEDQKGCRDTLFDVSIDEPLPISVDAGPAKVVELGDSTVLNGSFVVPLGVKSMTWSPEADFPVNGIKDPLVYPKTTTTYIYTIVDENGCLKSDTVTVRVEKSYNLYAPNIFTPKQRNDFSPFNDFFNVWSNKGVKHVETLDVYDRWGNLIYRGKDIKIGGELVTSSTNHGWDGYFNDQPVNPGVYVWRAKVVFIDDFVKEFAGDITVLR